MTGREREPGAADGTPPVDEPAPVEEPARESEPAADDATASGDGPTGTDAPAEGGIPEPEDAPEPEAGPEPETAPAPDAGPVRSRPRRRDPLPSALIGILTLLLGFAFAVQVRATDTPEVLQTSREEDLVRILDELNTSEERLRAQIADQREALLQLTSTDSQSAAALAEAQEVAESIGILNGTVAATGPGITMDIRDPADEVRVADVLDAIQELRGAGAETMQIDGVRVGVSTAVTGEPGALLVDGRPISAPYEFVVIGDPQSLETALNIPGGVVQRIANRGGTATIEGSDSVEVDALRPLDEPQYAAPETDG
jgi:uncharacterized protein YlxW (UPF0749 family)